MSNSRDIYHKIELHEKSKTASPSIEIFNVKAKTSQWKIKKNIELISDKLLWQLRI